jgi:hypothetical protein
MFDSIRCLLFGHDDWFLRSPDRLKLRCSYCHRETPGWRLTSPVASRQHAPGASSMPTLAKLGHRI